MRRTTRLALVATVAAAAFTGLAAPALAQPELPPLVGVSTDGGQVCVTVSYQVPTCVTP